MNLAEYAQTIQEKNLNFSDYAKNEFKVMDESCALGMELLRKAAAGDSDLPWRRSRRSSRRSMISPTTSVRTRSTVCAKATVM